VHTKQIPTGNHSSFASTEGVLRGGEQETLWPRTNKP